MVFLIVVIGYLCLLIKFFLTHYMVLELTARQKYEGKKDNGYSSIYIISQHKHVWIFQEEILIVLSSLVYLSHFFGVR